MFWPEMCLNKTSGWIRSADNVPTLKWNDFCTEDFPIRSELEKIFALDSTSQESRPQAVTIKNFVHWSRHRQRFRIIGTRDGAIISSKIPRAFRTQGRSARASANCCDGARQAVTQKISVCYGISLLRRENFGETLLNETTLKNSATTLD